MKILEVNLPSPAGRRLVDCSALYWHFGDLLIDCFRASSVEGRVIVFKVTFICFTLCVCASESIYHSTHTEVRGQLSRSHSLLPSSRSQELNSGHHTW